MKKLVTLLVVFSLTLGLAAQTPAGGGRQAPPSIGRIYGKLVDSTGKGIADASVVVLQSKMDTATKKMKDVLLKGVSTQGNGDFNLEGLPIFGPLKLSISGVGFLPLTQKVQFEMKMPAGGGAAPRSQQGGMPDLSAMAGAFEKDLGKITLQTDSKSLQGVVITATSSRLKMDIDKKVFNVGQNIVSAGGTAVDVMKNVPSVNVDIDGNVTLRNAAPQIYIDGRPTTLTLDQIPADAIESVEVITNPSAKYDASGGNAGILNIVLKKNKRSGYNGTINAGVDKRGGVNGGASLSVRSNKVNFSLAGFGNQMRNRSTSTTDIRSLLSSPNLLVNQDGRTNMKGGFLFGRAGLDYFVTNRTTLSAGFIRVHGEFNPGDVLRTDSSLANGQYLSYSERTTTNHREFNAHGFTGGFKYNFPKKGEEWTGDVNIFSGKNGSSSYYNTNVYTAQGGAQKGNIQQQILGSGTNKFTTLQTDYVNPIGTSGKIEAGARVQLRDLTNKQGNYYLNQGTGEFVLVPSSTTNYKNKDNVYAAYISFTNAIKNFGYQLGLRGESSDYQGELTDSKQTFTNKYPLSLFPSIFLSQKLKDKQELQLSYTRRINRPFFMQIIPFIDSTDQLNWSRGNAGLKPEFTNSLEASYTKTYKNNNTFLASVYYKYSTDLITRFLDTISVNGNEKRPISTYINANSSRSVGFELTTQNTLTKWWDMNANLNVYNSKINTENISSGSSQDPLWSYFAKMNSNFKLPKKFKVQISGTYQSKTNLPVNQGGGFGPGGGGPFGGGAQSAAQGYIKSNYGVDIALQKSFLKNDAASLTFNVSDVFRTRRFDRYAESTFFIQNSHRLNDVPMFRLNFSYRFGQMDLSLFKRKNMKGEQEGSQGAMQGMGQ
ncbi:TonB-dependent receptor [Flavisolibacter nicotianae]|uniref:TonB-dependent receptor n=1 Tax=Flavisolibacter nicotianae TaxID=2364882 RepID=UPI000EB54E7B|nr:TonB-dependent receptor [Flavisolibacter nicotianae]